MKNVITLVAFTLMSASVARAAEVRGDLGALELRGLTVEKIVVKADTSQILATLSDFGGILPPPGPIEPPFPPPEPPKPRSSSAKYVFSFDLSSAADVASYQLLLSAHGRWGAVDVSVNASGKVTAIGLSSCCAQFPKPIEVSPK